MGGTVRGTAAPEFTASDTWRDGRLGDEAAAGTGMDVASEVDWVDDVEGAPVRPEGRAARRRQLARWKKNKRRAVVATAVALVGGGLTLSAMDRHTTDRAQAATAPKDPSTGAVQEMDRTLPASAEPTAERSTPTPGAEPSTADVPRHASPAGAPLATAAPNLRPDAAAAPRPTSTPAPQRHTTSQSSQSSHATVPDTPTVTEPTSQPTGGTNSGGSQASPAPTATTPPQLCLLVVCLG
jgi:hypothetical protein